MLWLWIAKITLVPVAAGLHEPTEFVPHPQDSSLAWVTGRKGNIWEVHLKTGQVRPIADLGGWITTRGMEQGLLGLAFSPHAPEVFVNFTDTAGNTVVARIPLTSRGHPDLTRMERILYVEQPASNHNGGCLRFGPDGMLYVGLGDGGRAHDPWNNAQNTRTLLGKILRLDVRIHPSTVPPDNPFARRPHKGRPEIWIWGLRNPWKFSFDRVTGDLWIADVGQNRFEEVNRIPAEKGGLNLGWNLREGRHRHRSHRTLPENLVDPVWEYSHQEGCSITGGYVYRGRAIPELVGQYVFGDFCSGKIWAFDPENGKARLLLDSGLSISSFGEDVSGEIYVLDYGSSRLFRLDGGK